MAVRRNRHPLLLAALLLASLPAEGIMQSSRGPIGFFQEEISIQVRGDSCILTGTYHFRNQTARTAATELLYPFPRRLPPPRRIEVIDLSTGSRLQTQQTGEGALFMLSLPPWGETAYRVLYVQPTPSNTMEYLLSTGRSWGRPLERATFLIALPDSLKLMSISIPPDTLWKEAGVTFYVCRKRHFFPDRELTVRWQRRQRS